MHKLLTGFAVAAGLALSASAAKADCSGHNSVASTERQESIAMSTYDGAATPPVVEGADERADAAVQVCAEGDKECAAATE